MAGRQGCLQGFLQTKAEYSERLRQVLQEIGTNRVITVFGDNPYSTAHDIWNKSEMNVKQSKIWTYISYFSFNAVAIKGRL